MLRAGNSVRVIGFPPDNRRHWDIPTYLMGQYATVAHVSLTRIQIVMRDSGDSWNFPVDYNGILELQNDNKWNKLNYVSPFKPLNLP
jgi:hypothetical protein